MDSLCCSAGVLEMVISLKTVVSTWIESVLLMLFLGIPSLESLQEIISEEREGEWRRFRKDLLLRIANLNVVSSLLLVTTAAFLTTKPTSSIADWSQTLPYTCMGATFLLAFLAVYSGTFILFVGVHVQADFMRDILRKPIRGLSCLVLLMLPNLFISAATIAGIISVYAAVWHGESALAKVGLSIVITSVAITSITFIAIAMWTASARKRLQEA